MLFRSAFTGAVSDQVGKLVYADQGTLFLDEIGDMPLPLQAKLLRVLQDKECSPIGSNETVSYTHLMTSLNPVHTVGEQIAEVLRLHKYHHDKKAVEDRVDEILKMVGLPPERKHEYPHQFSGGMKQRIVIAIALACEPSLLLADEPTTALDVTIQAQVLAMMKELKDKLNTSMILITHDLGVVAETCDRVAIMYAGEVIESGTVEQIFEGEHHHPYTVGLFDSIPDLTKKTRRLNPIDGLMPDPTDLPSGCKFHTRCPKCMEICKSDIPPVNWIEGHDIKCHLYTEMSEARPEETDGSEVQA